MAGASTSSGRRATPPGGRLKVAGSKSTGRPSVDPDEAPKRGAIPASLGGTGNSKPLGGGRSKVGGKSKGAPAMGPARKTNFSV